MQDSRIYFRQINDIEVSVWKAGNGFEDRDLVVRFAKLTNSRSALSEISMADLPIIDKLVQSVIQLFDPAVPKELNDFDKICI
jgi:hypothetical protein